MIILPGDVLPGELVDPDDSVQDPVGVEEEVAVDGEIEGVLGGGQSQDNAFPVSKLMNTLPGKPY
jgi:hypothetical protein